MSLILEGCDGSGKTTLAKWLCQMEPRAKYYHSGGAPSSVDAENQFLVEQLDLAQSPFSIIDRATCISQQVYAGRMGEPKLQHALEELLSNPQVILIYCRPPTDHLMSPEKLNWRDVETEEYKQHIIKQQHVFIERYDQLMKNIPHLVYDFNMPEEEYVRNALKQCFSSQQVRRMVQNVIKISQRAIS